MTERSVLVRRYLISGRVQGVGYRYFTKRLADQLEIVGWVKNLSDGRVETRAKGTPEELERYRETLEQGPVGARVEQIEEIELTEQPGWSRFEIAF
jgi:acylphosphatase